MHRAGAGPMGRVLDLVIAVDSGAHHPLVTRVVVSPRRSPRLVDVHDLDVFDAESIVVAADARAVAGRSDGGVLELRDDELLLGRDVLDAQVIDLDGLRVARVADVVLEEREDGRLRVAGVDVGMGRVLSRLGLRSTGERRGEQFIDWHDLHLTSPRGHDVQLAAPRSAVHRLDAVGLASLLERLDVESATEVLSVVPPEHAAAAIASIHHHTAERLLRALPAPSARRILAHMPHPHRPAWEQRMSRHRPLRGRRFHRTKGWRRHPRSSS